MNNDEFSWCDDDALYLDDGMTSLTDLYAEDVGMRTEMGCQTEVEMESTGSQSELETTTTTTSTGTQVSKDFEDRGMQTEKMEVEQREVRVTVYKSRTLTDDKNVQTERSEAKSAKPNLWGRFLNEGSVFTSCNDVGLKIEENMRWNARIGERLNLGYWKEPFADYRLIAQEWEEGRCVMLEKKEDADRDRQIVKTIGKYWVKNLFRGGGFMTFMSLETIGKPNLYFALVTKWEYKLGDTFAAKWVRTTQDRYVQLELGDRYFGTKQLEITKTEMGGQERRESTMRYRY
jgi:hypothetical protein